MPSSYPIRTPFGIASLSTSPYGTKMERRKYGQDGEGKWTKRDFARVKLPSDSLCQASRDIMGKGNLKFVFRSSFVPPVRNARKRKKDARSANVVKNDSNNFVARKKL